MTLAEFLKLKEISPEMNNPLEFYRPNDFRLSLTYEQGNATIFEFYDGVNFCYIIDDEKAPHSILLTQEEYDSYKF